MRFQWYAIQSSIDSVSTSTSIAVSCQSATPSSLYFSGALTGRRKFGYQLIHRIVNRLMYYQGYRRKCRSILISCGAIVLPWVGNPWQRSRCWLRRIKGFEGRTPVVFAFSSHLDNKFPSRPTWRRGTPERCYGRCSRTRRVVTQGYVRDPPHILTWIYRAHPPRNDE